MTHPVMWFEVLGTDGGTLRKFYGDLFGWAFDVIPQIDYGVAKTGDSRVQLLRRRRTVVTARQIAGTLEVSERTVYRDIRDLIAAGTPIDGAAGVGYRLRPGYDLPPLMFDKDEIQAILSKVAGVPPKELEPTWTLAAWCEMRVGFRNFRLDRINQATLGDRFEDEPGRTLRDMLTQYGADAVRLLD